MRIFLRTLGSRLLNDNISFLAGGVAFYGLLALFPALGALVALLALIADPAIVEKQLHELAFLFPPDVYELLHHQILLLVQQSNKTLSLTLVLSIGLALFSANRGSKALLAALNTIFRVRENRKWWRQYLVSHAVTLGGMTLILLALFIIIALPLVLKFVPFTLPLQPLAWLRWLVLGGAMFVGVLLLFAFGPNVPLNRQSLREELIGTAVASGTWLVAAVVGSWAITKVPQLHAAYGSLSAVIVLMLWMVVSAYCLLLGAAVTAALSENSTSK